MQTSLSFCCNLDFANILPFSYSIVVMIYFMTRNHSNPSKNFSFIPFWQCVKIEMWQCIKTKMCLCIELYWNDCRTQTYLKVLFVAIFKVVANQEFCGNHSPGIYPSPWYFFVKLLINISIYITVGKFHTVHMINKSHITMTSFTVELPIHICGLGMQRYFPFSLTTYL